MNELTTTAQPTTLSILTNADTMNALFNFANLMSQGSVTVPKHLQGKPSDCLAITMQAAKWGMDPFVVAQKTHIVNGNLGYEAQLVNAVLMSSGAIRGRFHYEYHGEGLQMACRAGAIPSGEADIAWTEWLRIDQVTTKNSPLWKTNPKQQIAYLQVKNWGRLYAPGALLGVYTVDELDYAPAEPQIKDITPPQSSVDKLKPKKAAPAPVTFDEVPNRIEELLIQLNDCQTALDCSDWAENASKEYPIGTPAGDQLAAAWSVKMDQFSA